MQTQTNMPERPELREVTRDSPFDRGRAYGYAVGALAGIWLAVVLISIYSPDLVSGTRQERFPLAALVGPLAGPAAT